MVDAHLEAAEMAAGTQAAWDELQKWIDTLPPLVRSYANHNLTMDKLAPIVQAVVTAVDSIRDKAANPSQENSTT